MSITDRRGVTVSATDPAIGSDPNPGLAWKAPALVATTGSNISLSGLQTIDGVVLAAGDRVLVKDQTDQTTNGLYNAASSSWTRTIDANNSSQWTPGTQVLVTEGSVSGGFVYQLTTTGAIVLGTTLLAFARVPPIQFGQSTINFGAFPGATDATAVITGQAGIVAGSFVEAWIVPVATADHSADEHWLDPPRITAGNIVAGTGFTIYGTARDDKASPQASLPYGLWTVNWQWR